MTRQMTEFYDPSHRQLQDEFDSRGLADRLTDLIVRETFDEASREFVSAADFFMLATVDAQGFPTVSHKGGDPGFVKVTSERSLVFPCYDGNGMYLSMGNIDAHPQIGMLFISFETPHRLRVQGKARLVRDAETLALWPETALAVSVEVTNMWVNCPRYIHPGTRTGQSEYVPRAGVQTPEPEWKSLEMLADVVPTPAHELNLKS